MNVLLAVAELRHQTQQNQCHAKPMGGGEAVLLLCFDTTPPSLIVDDVAHALVLASIGTLQEGAKNRERRA